MPAAVRVFRSLEEAQGQFGPCALTIGNFDGVHAGHRAICRRVVETARRNGWRAALMTFEPHPTRIVAPERSPRLLSTALERSRWMAEEGVEHVLILPFTQELSEFSPREFVQEILRKRLEARAVFVGDNFRFGYRQAGDTRTLEELGREMGFQTGILHAVSQRGRLVSSSEIRRAIDRGDVARAARMLGRPHVLEGEVVTGKGIGTQKTVPTLNLSTRAEVLPARGVYVTRTADLAGGRAWPSVTNVGVRPTFGGEILTIETYLLDELAGETPHWIRVELLYRLRDEKRFENADALKAQILRDVARARAYHRRTARWVKRV